MGAFGSAQVPWEWNLHNLGYALDSLVLSRDDYQQLIISPFPTQHHEVELPTDAACCPDTNIEDVVGSSMLGEIAENTAYTQCYFWFRIQSFQGLGFRACKSGRASLRAVNSAGTRPAPSALALLVDAPQPPRGKTFRV